MQAKTFIARRGTSWTTMALIAFALGACGGDDEPAPDAQVKSPKMIAREAPGADRGQNGSAATRNPEPDFQVMPAVEGSLEQEGMGLETVINAGSKEEYAQSLQWIAEDTSREQFDRLETSIRYIHMYDVYGNEEALYDKLDGMTGTEVIAHADRMIAQRQGGRTRTEMPSVEYDNDGN